MIYTIILFSFLFSYNDYDGIYNIISSARNNAVGGVHMSTDNIDSIFDAPSKLNHKNNLLKIFQNY